MGSAGNLILPADLVWWLGVLLLCSLVVLALSVGEAIEFIRKRRAARKRVEAAAENIKWEELNENDKQ